MTREGTEKLGAGDGALILPGLDSGVKGPDPLTPMIYGWSPLPLEPMFKAMSSLDCRLSKFGLEPAAALLDGPEEVLGLAGMTGGTVLTATAAATAVDVLLEGVLGRGGMGRGRSR